MNGHAIAGGCILSLCCDERILASGAKIGLNEAAFGIMPPPFAAALMIDTIGNRLAQRALTLGNLYNAGN
jgi:3,2-trans-enoyl-CoA isomerase